MIACKIKGGLGNQMFQIATIYALAREYNAECVFDFSAKVAYQGNPAVKYMSSIYRGLSPMPQGWKPKVVFRERSLKYAPIMFVDGMAIDGYFQSERYFVKYADEIRRWFRDENIISFLRGYYAPALKNSLSIHVRRGDFLNFCDVFEVMGEDYYDRAIKKVDSKHKIDYIFVMSDDIKWCRANLKDERMVFLSGHPDHHEMLLMSLCSHNIIANSSFSWWGAWLGETEGKMIIAPNRWLKKEVVDIIPERWIRL